MEKSTEDRAARGGLPDLSDLNIMKLHVDEWGDIRDAAGLRILAPNKVICDRSLLHVFAAAPDLYDAVNALLGLIVLVNSRDDMPENIHRALATSHRVEEAHAALAKARGLSPHHREKTR